MIDTKVIIENLEEIKDAIKNIVNNVVRDDLDLHTISLDNLDYHIQRIAGEIATAYTLLGQANKEEKNAEIALKKQEASIYMSLVKKSEGKPTIENLKRETLLDKNLIPYQKTLADALCKTTTIEGMIESLKTKREIIKSLSIKQHQIEKSGDY